MSSMWEEVEVRSEQGLVEPPTRQIERPWGPSSHQVRLPRANSRETDQEPLPLQPSGRCRPSADAQESGGRHGRSPEDSKDKPEPADRSAAVVTTSNHSDLVTGHTAAPHPPSNSLASYFWSISTWESRILGNISRSLAK